MHTAGLGQQSSLTCRAANGVAHRIRPGRFESQHAMSGVLVLPRYWAGRTLHAPSVVKHVLTCRDRVEADVLIGRPTSRAPTRALLPQG